MLGTEGAVALVVARLQTEMPAKVTEVAGRYHDTAAVNVRPPKLYAESMYERLELAQYPAVEVASRDDGIPDFNSQAQGVENYWIAYSLRVYVTERGQTYQQVEARRRRLTLAVREVLFSTPELQAGPPRVWINPRSIRSSYFGIGTINESDSRSIAATYTDLDVIVEEMTEPYMPTTTGTADRIFVNVHPANRG
jgi:hypothetical protein